MTTLYIECCKGFVYILKHAMGIALVWHPKERNIQKHVMRTDPKTPIRTYYKFRGLIRGFEGFNQVRIAGQLENQEEIQVHLIHVQEGSNTTLFGS